MVKAKAYELETLQEENRLFYQWIILAISSVFIVFSIFPAHARAAPDSFADLTEQVMDAVVNISASTTIDPESRNRQPDLNNQQPFEDLFEEFFRQRRGGGGPVRPRQTNSLGSGFVIDPSGIVITNNHVIGEANDITVILQDGTKLKAEIVGKDPKIDIAVLKVKSEKPLKHVAFGDSETLRSGDWVVAIGNPYGLGGTVTAGIVSARGRNIESGPYDNYIQTDAAINKGNSGGPLFNMKGEVVGINTAIFSPTGGSVGIGFAVPSNSAVPVVEQLKEFGETRRGWLGVRIQNVDEDTADALKLAESEGALIAGVEENGPAKKAGIEVGDVIVKFNGKSIKGSRDLARFVAEAEVGKEVEVILFRKGKEQSLQVTLGRLETEEVQASEVKGSAAKTGSQILGLSLSPITSELRDRYRVDEGIKGVMITRVDPRSSAATKRLEPGDVILEVGQEAVKTPADISRKIEEAKKEGRRSILFLVSSGRSRDSRFVALSLNEETKEK